MGTLGILRGRGSMRRLRTKAICHFEKEYGVNSNFHECSASRGINVPSEIMSSVAVLMERCQLRLVFEKLARRKTQGGGTKKWVFHRHSTEDI